MSPRWVCVLEVACLARVSGWHDVLSRQVAGMADLMSSGVAVVLEEDWRHGALDSSRGMTAGEEEDSHPQIGAVIGRLNHLVNQYHLALNLDSSRQRMIACVNFPIINQDHCTYQIDRRWLPSNIVSPGNLFQVLIYKEWIRLSDAQFLDNLLVILKCFHAQTSASHIPLDSPRHFGSPWLRLQTPCQTS